MKSSKKVFTETRLSRKRHAKKVCTGLNDIDITVDLTKRCFMS